MPDPRRKVLILLDGDQVSPERAYLTSGAQGGSLLAFQLAEQARRWVSSHDGSTTSILSLWFADATRLGREVDVPVESVLAFAKGFSSTPTPSAFVPVLQGNVLAALSAHLAFHAPLVEYVFLAGFTTPLHVHHVDKVCQTPDRVPSLVVVEAGQPPPPPPGMDALAIESTRFQGLASVGMTLRRDISTQLHDELPDGYPASRGPSAASTSVRPIATFVSTTTPPPSPSPKSSKRPFPAASRRTRSFNPWALDEDDQPPLRQAAFPPGLAPSPTPSPAMVNPPLGASSLAPSLGEVSTRSFGQPRTSPSTSTASMADSGTTLRDPARAAIVVGEEEGERRRPTVRVAAIPDRYLSLVLLVSKYQRQQSIAHVDSSSPATTTTTTTTSSPVTDVGPSRPRDSNDPSRATSPPPPLPPPGPPLWSTIGSDPSRPRLASLGYPKSTKLKDWILDAQRAGWVVCGKGQGEGTEWVKVSQRAERALKRHHERDGARGKDKDEDGDREDAKDKEKDKGKKKAGVA
ncbi:hypothetical protein JCM10212_001186 [Sporobolomyces blumeae]